MHVAPLLALWGILAIPASGAYVQHQPCDGDGLDPLSLPVDSLRAKLSSSGDDAQTLSWQLGLMVQSEEECSNLARNVTASLSVSTVFNTEHRQAEPVTTCYKLYREVMGNTHGLQVALEESIPRFYPLETFHSEIRMGFLYNDTSFCTQANVTPSLGETSAALLRWLPTSIFLFVFVVGILRSCFDRPIRLPSDREEVQDFRRDRPVLPHVGDCLQYLQFIFLTGGLSLRYPGFYQPAVSCLNWFSLLLTGPVTKGFVYPKIADGIYEINGTYGGTFGMELMHQIVGAPTTMATWLNMAISITIIAAVAAIVLEGVHLILPKSNDEDIVIQRHESLFSHFSFRLKRVLRVVLSYFTLPLVAFSFYQFDNAPFLPGYHTSLATLLLVCIIAAFFWLVYQVPVRSLGMLVFDSKRYQSMSPLSTKDRYGNLFIMILFVSSFIRGVAIGGLQVSPEAQLVILGSGEIILLVCVSGFQAYPMWSIGTMSSVFRLLTVGLMAAFLPGLGASLGAKSLIGYVILGMHSVMLLCGFFVPAMYNVCLIGVRNWAAPKPEVYGLRALQRRGATSSTDMLRLSNVPQSPRISSHHGSPNLSGSNHRFSPDPRQAEFLHRPSHYFRPPRPTSQLSLRSSDDLHSKKIRSSTSSKTLSSTSTTGESARRVASPKPKPAINLNAIREPRDYSLTRSSESTSSGSASAGSPTTSNISSRDSQGRPLGPRWNDYSFREADLYYMAGQAGPSMADDDIVEEETEEPANKWHTIRKVSSGLWSRVVSVASTPPAEERGFSVVRPNRPPQGAYIPPQRSQTTPSAGPHLPVQQSDIAE